VFITIPTTVLVVVLVDVEVTVCVGVIVVVVDNGAVGVWLAVEVTVGLVKFPALTGTFMVLLHPAIQETVKNIITIKQLVSFLTFTFPLTRCWNLEE
jgi:hypothetical protein